MFTIPWKWAPHLTPVGARYRYRVDVTKARTIQLASDQAQRTVDDARIEADETVLASGPQGIRVQVELRRSGSARGPPKRTPFAEPPGCRRGSTRGRWKT